MPSTYDLTNKDVDDASHVPTLLDQLTQDLLPSWPMEVNFLRNGGHLC